MHRMLAALLAVMLAAPAWADDAVSLRLNWYMGGVHAPFFLGKERGYYREAGLDLTVNEGRGSANTAQVVAAGTDTFGLANSSSVMRLVSKDAGIRTVMSLLNTSSFGVISLAETGIRAPRDLEGKKLAITAGDALTQLFPAFAGFNKLDTGKITLVQIDPAGKVVALLEKRVDAILGGLDDQYFLVKQKGFDPAGMGFAKNGINTVGLTILTQDATIVARPELVRRFVAATQKSWAAAKADPDAAIAALMKAKQGLDFEFTEEPARRRPAEPCLAGNRGQADRLGRAVGLGVDRDATEAVWQSGDGPTGKRLLHQRLPAAVIEAPAAIVARGLSKTFQRSALTTTALASIDLRVAQGEFVAIVGPSGCGKSTLLRLIAGLLRPSAGEVVTNGHAVTKPVTDIGIVFQNPVLLDWRSVLGNVLVQVELRGLRAAAYRERAVTLLQAAGLGEFLASLPRELSGGMRQRTSIVRALIHDPPLLIMDEPFGALDALTREQMRIDLEALWLRTRKTVLFVTHSIDEAVLLADRVVVMSPRPGRIERIIEVDLPRPRGLDARQAANFVETAQRITRIFLARGILHGSGGL